MKYNEELFSISGFLNQNTEEENCLKEVKCAKRKLFRIMVERFKTSLPESGVVKIIFKKRFCGDEDEGYKLVKELIERNAFSSFSKDYLIYITDYSKDSIECDDYYELTWDFENYFEVMNILGKMLKLPEKYEKIAEERIGEVLESTKKEFQEAKTISRKAKKEIVIIKMKLLKLLNKDRSSLSEDGKYIFAYPNNFYNAESLGYTLVKLLIEAGEFSSFADRYYVTLQVESPSYYVLTWDYERYFEDIKKNKALKREKRKKNNKKS